MFRRRFIRLIAPFTTSIVFSPQSIFAKIVQQITGTGNQFIASGRIHLNSKTLRVDESVPLAMIWSQDFMSLEDFSQAFHFGLYTNEQKRKSVLYIEKDRITFTADNTFVKFNDQMLQIPLRCHWHEDSVWVPVVYFVNILNKYTPFQFQYNVKSKTFGLEETNVNISGVRIDGKENGTLIDVFATKRFKEKEITIDIRNRWLHIDIYGAKIDVASLATVPPSGIISEVKAFQMGETASISFKLKKEVLSRELVLDKTGNDFHVNLRTKEIIAENQEHEKIKNELEEQKKRWLIDTVVIDAGHGGKDPGAIGYSKVKEKNLVLPMALALGKLIQNKMPEIKVVYTRKKDVFIELSRRTKIANDVNANLFISIHCNSNVSSRPNGYETYFISADKNIKATDVVLKENSAIQFEESQDRKKYEGANFILASMLQNDNIKHSQVLASHVQNSLILKLNKIGMTSRGVKQGPFWVLVGATMPNILVECGYISNKHEEKLLREKTTQNKIAEGIFAGIKMYKDEVEKAI